MGIISCVSVLLCSILLCEGKISEYQLESETLSRCELLRVDGAAQQREHVPQCSEGGRFRHVQCTRDSSECWCVDAEGSEIAGSRQNGSAVHCLSSCQLQRQRALLSGDAPSVPLCLESGEYQPIQCQRNLGQCWCVDQEGMEIYGTRQNGKPSRCPGSCEIRERRLLHGVGESSPPQCSADGNFLPVQCKFVNTTDMTVVDLLHTFNRMQRAFQTFSGFREAFPEVSSYCFCADSRGRELANTGVELLLDEVYDTAFSGMDPGRSFSQSNMYRILQRRYLGIQLAMGGRFRCPTKCESERSSSAEAGNVFVPSCDASGSYAPVQCQAGGQCWCVDSDGREIYGTRLHGGKPICSSGVTDCPSERRQALSRLFYGLSGPFVSRNLFSQRDSNPSPLSPCSPEVQELLAKSGLLVSVSESGRSDLGEVLAEVIQGMFPTGSMALKALSLTTNPKRLQENLFGGKFLKNAGNFNFSTAVGARGTFSFGRAFSQVGLRQVSADLAQLAKVFSPEASSVFEAPTLDREISDPLGRLVNLKKNRDLVKLVGSTLESEQFLATLRNVITVMKAEDSVDLGGVFRAVFQSSQPGACQRDSAALYVPQCTETGQYQQVQCQGTECWCVDSRGVEVLGSRSKGRRPRCLSQCESEREMAVKVRAGLSAGSQVFIPKCEEDGSFAPLQCSGKDCFCMDREGGRHDATMGPGGLQCPTDCQVSAAGRFLSEVRSVLSDPAAMAQLSDVYVPQCDPAGAWRQIQCNGPPEQAFQFYRDWVRLNNAGQDLPVSEVISILRGYGKRPEVLASFGGFVKLLFDAGHQSVFPVLSQYETFDSVPAEVLAGDSDAVFGPTVFLNPLSLWRLLQGNVTQYPGQASDFSVPLGHFHLRQCWCVGARGDMIANTKAAVNQIPKCPGSCSLVERQISQFRQDTEAIISLSNSSNVPLGYGFLLAMGLSLTPQELQHSPPVESIISDTLLIDSYAALRLAAHSTLQFYWQSHISRSDSDREALLLGYQPYTPQCDSNGLWLPTQCYPSTGHCWCVDGEGRYIPESLTSRSMELPQCGTPCQRAHTQALLSDWMPSVSEPSDSFYNPTCEESGEFSVLQRERADSGFGWCVSPLSGKAIQPAVLSQTGDIQCPSWCQMLKEQVTGRKAGTGYEPECKADGQGFSPMQCDHGDCWCVSPNGQELPGTRTPRNAGQTPACDSPQCPLPFSELLVAHGALLCSNIMEDGQQRQRCQLVCHQGYESALSVDNFLCDLVTGNWVSDAPLPHACQRLQVLQSVQASSQLQLSVSQRQQSCSSIRTGLQLSLLQDMRSRGLCSLQVTSPTGELSFMSACDDSSVLLECDTEETLRATLAWRARLSDVSVQALPDLHDIDVAFTAGKLLEGAVDLIRSGSYQSTVSVDGPVDPVLTVTFGCAPGYRRVPGNTGCVACPAGTFFTNGGCSLCPEGSYQDQKGQDFCDRCPRGTSTASPGAFRATHCASECQRSGQGCTDSGAFQAAQLDVQMGKWLCMSSEGKRLLWTSSVEPLSEPECRVMEKFEDVPRSQWRSDDAILLGSRVSEDALESQLRKCISDCAANDSCHHLALFTDGGRKHCDLYSTDGANIECKASEKTKGFLGNPGADMYQSLSCLLKVKGDRPDLVVLRKKGYEFTTSSLKTFERLKFRKASSGVYRTAVFQAQGASLTDVHRFCQDTCSQESCCDGFILNQNILNGGTVLCGLLSFPDLLLCSDEDWDVSGTSKSNRICGAGVQYNKQRKQFTFSFGGQNFTITDAALPPTSKNKTDYQATIIGFQRIYLWRGSDMTTRQKSSPECPSVSAQPDQSVLISDAVKEGFMALDNTDIRVNPSQAVPSQQYWIFKHQFSAEDAQRWCLKRCEEEGLCHVADIRDDSPTYFTCALYPDTQVCGAYDTPLRQPCSLVLPQPPHKAHSKKVNLLGSVESFYSRVPFKKMVSYSVRSRVSLGAKPITEGFFECERRCDEDPCCRGIGYVRDSQSGADALCLTLNSFGIQTCGEEDQTAWRAMDCTPSKVVTGVFPFGWYEKPVNQWTSSPDLCPPFSLPTATLNVTLSDWALVDTFSTLVDPSVSTFDVIHISNDIAEDFDRARDWCLSACERTDSCSVVTVERRESAVHCVLYPDTHACMPSAEGQSCRLLIRESASHVYLRKGLKSELKSVLIPGHGTLVGESKVTVVGSERKRVSHFLGVPYALPPIRNLRFSPPQAAEWSGTWNATFPRSSCLQPGDGDSSSSSEDCLYLNVFVPSSNRGNSPVLVFFYNPTRPARADDPALLDGSYLAAASNIIVVTVHFRSAVFGFLSTASAASPGNAGLQDQVAALKWVQQNIAHFGGDPSRVTLGAERSGADVASLHLISAGAAGLFHRALLMGGSAFSPAAVIGSSRARELTSSLVREVGCSSPDPAQVVSCLREIPAPVLNSAQTKLLAVSGPLRAWAPVVDGISVREKPSLALQRTRFCNVDIMLGSSAEDGLISRAKNIKKFEELQGRANGKTAFYEALSNSLGGDSANAFVKEAATWFYSMQHSPTPAGYNVFSRALENATRDFFIICPAVQMARFCAAQSRSNVFMYHLPEKMAQTSADLSMPLDLQFVFGVPHHSRTHSLFTSRERRLAQQMMAYVANFVKSGNPNYLHFFSQASFSESLPPWPRFLPSPEGDNYKEVDMPLSNHKGLRRAECSFWADYVPQLTASTAKLSPALSEEETNSFGTPTQETKLFNVFRTSVTQSKPKSEKDAYN
ncbi:thyroglobulin [Anguilla rostrata]|uniref:thyroglobulin n=1 Tax=Anguilla rostrata TaxID=7938 RepID=UPI0030D4B260